MDSMEAPTAPKAGRHRPTISNFMVEFSRADYRALEKVLGERYQLVKDFEYRTQKIRSKGGKSGKGGISFTKDLFAEAKASFIVSNAHPSISNALRRVLMDECNHYVLAVHNDTEYVDESASDPFCVNSYIAQKIGCIPLKCRIADKRMTFRLAVENTDPIPRMVYAGDLVITHDRSKPGQDASQSLPFDPRYEIAYLQPGKRVSISTIEIVESNSHTGLGERQRFGLCGKCIPIDVEKHDKKETHLPGGAHVDDNEFKFSPLIFTPMKHLVEITFTQVEDDRDIVKDIHLEACDVLIKRLKKIQNAANAASKVVKDGAVNHIDGDVSISSVRTLDMYEFTMIIKNETWTISSLMRAQILHIEGDILYCASDMRTTDRGVSVVLKSTDDPLKIVATAAGNLVDIYEGFKTDLRK